MPHGPFSEILLPESSLRNVSDKRKLKCPLCGQESYWLNEMTAGEEEPAWAVRSRLRMRALALVLTFSTDAESYADEFQKVLALPL